MAAARFARAAAVAVPVLLLLLAGGLRLARIDQPDRLTFDEKHYVPDAREYLGRGVEIDRPAHPPAGKWFLAASIRAAGDRPLGWRLAPALAGVIVVGATYLMGLHLFRRLWAASLAALLVAVDGLALSMSRIAMLDGIQAALVALGALFVLWDRRAADRRWRWAAGVALGLAVAVKWSSAPALVVAAVVVLAGDLRGTDRSIRSVLGAVRRLVLPLAVVPVGLYVASYAGWFANVDRTETAAERCPDGCSLTEVVSGWAYEQWDMWDLQGRLEPTHPDRSTPVAWLTLARPVLYYADSCVAGADVDDCTVPEGTRARTLGLGNPALWWTALPVYAYLAWAAVVRRDRRALFVGAFVAGMVLPWFASWKPGFAFYLTPVTPFVALAVTLAAVDAVGRWRVARALPVLLALAAIALAVWFYPVWSGTPMTPAELRTRLWFESWR